MTKLYTDHNILWVKHATNQKAESIRIVSFSKLDKRSTAALSSIQSMLNSLKNDRCSFIFTILFVHTTTPTICNKNPFFYFCQFSPPYSTLTWSQNHLYNPHQHSLPLHLSHFSPPNKLHQKIFSLPQPFSQFRLCQGPRELGSLVGTDTAWICPFFLKV